MRGGEGGVVRAGRGRSKIGLTGIDSTSEIKIASVQFLVE